LQYLQRLQSLGRATSVRRRSADGAGAGDAAARPYARSEVARGPRTHSETGAEAMNIFLAGASGVIGRRLVPMLRDARHTVTGTTRSAEKAAALEALGAKGIVVDVYDARTLLKVMNAAHPDVVIHQLTDLPDSIDPVSYPAALARNSRVRSEGTPN